MYLLHLAKQYFVNIILLTSPLQFISCHVSHPECVTLISFYKSNRPKLDKNKAKGLENKIYPKG